MIHKLLTLCLGILFITACTSEKSSKAYVETIEIYGIKGDKDKAEKGSMIYKEMTSYLGKDRPEWRKFFEKNGDYKAIERYSYRNDGLPSGSAYFDKDENLLSNYVFTNEEGKQVRNVGLDGNTNEVLRIEEFSHDEAGNRVQKLIKDASSNIVRTYRFGFDDYGNETSMTVANSDGKAGFTETYTITQKNDIGLWTEAWGWRNNSPTSIKVRTFEYK